MAAREPTKAAPERCATFLLIPQESVTCLATGAWQMPLNP
jgi:hypothetical protein